MWLVRQVPRRGLATPFRLTDDLEQGLTRVAPGVLSEAVEHQLESFGGVSKATAQLRGSVRDPELTVRVTADERTDLRELVSQIQQQTVPDLQTALDTTVTRLGVQVEVDRVRSGAGHVTL